MVKMWEHTTSLPDTVSWCAHVQDGLGYTYVTGNTIVSGDKANILTTKYDRAGAEIWQVSYNSSYDDNDYGTAITIDTVGNVYVAAASFTSATNQYDYRVIKYDSTGSLQWTNTYNGTGSLYDIPSVILVDDAGNVYITGGSYGSGTGWDYATIKYNSSGTQQWVSRYNYNDSDDAASGLAINSNGRILVTGGSAQAADNWDFASVKYNQNTGAQIDVQRNTASGLGIDRVYGFAIDGDDNIYLTGRAAISGEGYNIRTVKMDSMLTVHWNKQYDAAEKDDAGYAVVIDAEGNVYVTGSITNADEIQNCITIKYNSAGTLQWTTIETANNSADLATWNTDISLSEEDEIIIAGITHTGANKDFIIYIYNSEGEKQWTETWNGPGNGDDTPYFIHADINNQLYIGGKTWNGTNDVYILIRYKQITYTTPPDDDTDKPTPLAWFENKGQIIDTEETIRTDIRYYTQRHYPALYASDDSLFMVFSRIDTNTTTDDTLARIDIGYYNSSSTKEIHHATSNGGEYLNYFLAHTGADGITNVQQHEKLYITELYPKVDLMYYFDNAGIKYYLIIKPGYSAQNHPIQMVINGATKTINADTTLTLSTDIEEITFRTPDAYQIDDDGSRIDLTWNATYNNVSSRIGFGLGSYTSSKVVVLEIGVELLEVMDNYDDENIYWSTIYGSGELEDYVIDCKYANDGNPVLLFQSTSDFFPDDIIITEIDLTGLMDINLIKFDNERTPLFGVIYGGTYIEYPYDMDVVQKPNGHIYVVGSTLSTNFVFEEGPFVFSYFHDDFTSLTSQGFIFRLNAYGTGTDWSTFLEGVDFINSIDINDDDSEISLGGRIDVFEDDWILHDLGGDAFYEEDNDLSKNAFSTLISFNASLELIWATKFWGIETKIVKYDSKESINIAGYITDAFYFEVVDESDGGITIGESFDFGGGELDPYFATFNEDKILLWATPYGGTGQDFVTAIVTSQYSGLGDAVYFLGYTGNNIGETDMDWPAYSIYESSSIDYFKEDYTDIESASEHSYDGFITKFSDERVNLLSTLFGGDYDDRLYDAVKVSTGIWFIGSTRSDNTTFPYTSFPDFYNGQDDLEADANEHNGYLAILTENSELIYATYFGNKQAVWALDIAVQVGSFTDYVIATGDVHFDELESSEFTPLAKPFVNAWFNPVNPTPYLESKATFITEWYKLPVPVSNEENGGFDKSGLHVYPNPTNNNINLKTNSEWIEHVRLYNANGLLLNEWFTQSTDLIFDLKTFPSGLYTLVVNFEHNYATVKIIKL